MKVKAVYHQDIRESDGELIHAIDHDGGGFVVSSKEVGVAVQNFVHYATASDIYIVHGYLLRLYHEALKEIELMEEQEDREPGDE